MEKTIEKMFEDGEIRELSDDEAKNIALRQLLNIRDELVVRRCGEKDQTVQKAIDKITLVARLFDMT